VGLLFYKALSEICMEVDHMYTDTVWSTYLYINS